VLDGATGFALGRLPAAALDSALHRPRTKALRSGESAVAAARVEPGAQVSGKRRGGSGKYQTGRV